MDTIIQQSPAHAAVSDPLAGDVSRITWPPETESSVMGHERGGTDVMGPGGFPCRPQTESSVMGYERGGTDVMGPGGFPYRPRPSR
jgi:hypothetical protein